MALADSVPGVSGGTIAFILGFYEDLLESITAISSKNKEKLSAAYSFLIKLGIGWSFGMISSVLFLSNMFEKNIYFMSSLFIGLTTASIIYIIKNEYKRIQIKPSYFIFTIIGILLVVVISILRRKLATGGITYLGNLNIIEYMYLFFVGMIAISAMVLPGISGSTMLLIFGAYIPIITALNEIIKGKFNTVPGLVVFIFGILFGLVFSVRLIRRAFMKHRSKMIFLIIGLTMGSIYAIMQGPTTLAIPKEMINNSNFNIIGFVCGVLILVALSIISDRNRKSVF